MKQAIIIVLCIAACSMPLASYGFQGEEHPPLIYTIQQGLTDNVKDLLASGAKVDIVDSNGDSPLHWASRKGDTDMVKSLIAAGADPKAVDKDGDQPLHWAARYGNYGNNEMVKALLAAGAKEDTPNKKGEQPITIIKHIGPEENYFGNKGTLDEASINVIKHTIDPILIKDKICKPTNTGGCWGGDHIECLQSSYLSCAFYGVSDADAINEISSSLQNSGLRIGEVTFWKNLHDSVTFFERPISTFDGHAGKDKGPISQTIASLFFVSLWFIPCLFLAIGPAIIILFSKKVESKVKLTWFLYCLASITIVPFLAVCLMEAEINNKSYLRTFEWIITPIIMLSGWIVLRFYNKKMGLTPTTVGNPWGLVEKEK